MDADDMKALLTDATLTTQLGEVIEEGLKAVKDADPRLKRIGAEWSKMLREDKGGEAPKPPKKPKRPKRTLDKLA